MPLRAPSMLQAKMSKTLPSSKVKRWTKQPKNTNMIPSFFYCGYLFFFLLALVNYFVHSPLLVQKKKPTL